MHKHTSLAPVCRAVVKITDGGESPDRRAQSRLIWVACRLQTALWSSLSIYEYSACLYGSGRVTGAADRGLVSDWLALARSAPRLVGCPVLPRTGILSVAGRGPPRSGHDGSIPMDVEGEWHADFSAGNLAIVTR
jgi:hypothetical protein